MHITTHDAAAQLAQSRFVQRRPEEQVRPFFQSNRSRHVAWCRDRTSMSSTIISEKRLARLSDDDESCSPSFSASYLAASCPPSSDPRRRHAVRAVRPGDRADFRASGRVRSFSARSRSSAPRPRRRGGGTRRPCRRLPIGEMAHLPTASTPSATQLCHAITKAR